MVLKEIVCEFDWILLAQDRAQSWVLVNTVMSRRFP
jgi:hypothetical protein